MSEPKPPTNNTTLEREFDILTSQFPSLYEVRKFGKQHFETALLLIRTNLLSLSVEKKKQIFFFGRGKFLSSGRDFRKSGKYWIFSHPNFEIFQKFLNDEKLYGLFVNYLYMAAHVAEGGSSIKKRIKRFVSSRDILTAFGRSYAKLISENVEYLVDKSAKYGLNVFTGNKGELSESGEEHRNVVINNLWEQKVEEVIKDRLYKIASARASILHQNNSRIQLSKIFEKEEGAKAVDFDEDFNMTGEEEKYQILASLVKMECFRFNVKIPAAFKPATVDAVSKKIFEAIRRGGYPVFQHSDNIFTELENARVSYTLGDVDIEFDEDKLFAVEDRYTKISTEGAKEYFEFMQRISSVEKGLLPIGVKIHCLKANHPAKTYLQTGFFAAHHAHTSFNLPPVGNVEAAIELIRKIEEKSGVKILNNPENYYVQICSPGRLNNENSGILTMAFLIGSDIKRNFSKMNLETTHNFLTGNKIAIYDAGIQDASFKRYGADYKGRLVMQSPFPNKGRTDILLGISQLDIRNVNLVASLLEQYQFGGFFEEIGGEFVFYFKKILEKHQLLGLLNTLWIIIDPGQIRKQSTSTKIEFTYQQAMTELQNYLNDEVNRINKANEQGPAFLDEEISIFDEIANLLDYCRIEMENKLGE